jgi:hypothetical protein
MKIQSSGKPVRVKLTTKVTFSSFDISRLFFKAKISPLYTLFLRKLAFSFLIGKAGSPKLSSLYRV